MKVMYDSQIFSFQKFGGISLYFAKLIQHLPDAGAQPFLPCRNAVNYHICEHFPDVRYRSLESKPARAALYAYNIVNDVSAAVAREYDVLHSTYYLRPHRYLYKVVDRPHVITIHDMIPEIAPQFFRRNPHFDKIKYCQFADAIFCNSEATKKDLVRIYTVPQNKIFVIHHGVDSRRVVQEEQVATPGRYVLFVGKRDAYKNFTVLPRALQMVRERYPDLGLVCVGGGKFTQSELTLLRESGLIDRASQISASSAQLAFLYRRAQSLVFPSLYEGFGLPVLEAMAQGCVPVISDIPCFREIADGAAIFIQPEDPRSVAEGVLRAMARDVDKQQFVERVKAFSWEETTRKAMNIYRTLV